MPAADGASSWHDPAGPVDDDVQCEHGGPTLPSDPDGEHVVRCTQTAVFRAPWPSNGVMGVRAVCPWHLARLLRDHEEDVRAKLEGDFYARKLVPERAFLELTDVPGQFRWAGLPYKRLGLDQRGHAHFYRSEADRVVVLDARFDLVRSQGLGEAPLARWLRFVRDRRGWAAFDDRVRLQSPGSRREAEGVSA